MPHNPFYMSPFWRRLRALALYRDGYRCVVAGCGRRAVTVDHIRTRPRVPFPCALDVLDNLRSLCVPHAASVRESPGSGTRGHGGKPVVKGVDVGGWPYSCN